MRVATPPVLTPDARAGRKEWIERNPIRAWRLSQDPKVTILEAAELIGVGMSMIQMYERGVHKPGVSRDAAMCRTLGADWSDRWDTWVTSRPARP